MALGAGVRREESFSGLPATPRFELFAGTTVAATGAGRCAARDLDDALDLARAIGDRHGEAQALNARGRLRRPSHAPSATADHESALALARELGNPGRTGAALLGAGRCERDLGRTDAAGGRLWEALTLYEGLGAPEAPSVAAELADLRA
ncbi:hypothetical protein [Kitasatospora sp. NPDC008115]|uniref:hypothetical protein n=1 Tax=Kitasatospora sp. NPDC008115 TaxID=3364022 RepID=UPI0036E549D7